MVRPYLWGLLEHDRGFHKSPVLPTDDAHKTASPIDHADASVTKAKLSFGTWEKVADVLVGADTTSITVTSLNLDADKAYLFMFAVLNPTASDSVYDIFLNNDTNPGNYYGQYIYGTYRTINVDRVNEPRVGAAGAGSEGFFKGMMMRPAGREPRWFVDQQYYEPSVVELLIWAEAWTTSANVTQVQIAASVANAIGAGSRLIIFKVSA